MVESPDLGSLCVAARGEWDSCPDRGVLVDKMGPRRIVIVGGVIYGSGSCCWLHRRTVDVLRDVPRHLRRG